MATVSTSNSFSTSAATNKGMSGLVSNMDTESMVESLLSGTQTKIDKQNQEKQVITWKQEMYRDIITDINTFQSTYFNSSSSTNMLSSSLFNSMSATTTSSAVSVTATSSAATGKTTIQVGRLATATTLKSGESVSGKLTSTMDLNALKRTVVFQVGAEEVSIDLTKAVTTQELADQINASTELQSKGITASVDAKTGKLVIAGEDVSVSSKSSRLGMQMLGVSAGSKTTDGTLSVSTDPDADATITILLDGVSHTITLNDMDQNTSTDDAIESYLQDKLNQELGSGNVSVSMDNGELELTTSAGRQIIVGGNKITYQLFGIQEGQSNKIALGQKLQDVGFQTKLQGSAYKFKINDIDFEFDSTATVNEVINKINSSKANVRVTYSELEDKFTIESSYTGSGYTINMEQSAGNLLNSMFGDVAATGKTVASNALSTNSLSSNLEADAKTVVNTISSFTSGTFKLTVDGTGYSISVPSRTEENGGAYTRDEVFALINQGLADRFGYQGDEQSIELVSNGDGYKLEVRNGSTVSFAENSNLYTDDSLNSSLVAKAAASNLQLAFGFENTSNTAKSASVTLEEVGFSTLVLNDGTSDFASFSGSDTIESVIAALETKYGAGNAAFDADTGKIIVNGSGTLNISATAQDGSTASDKLFGTDTLAFQSGTETVHAVEGQNAQVTINGVTTERSSNTFTTGGLNITLLDKTNESEPAAINTSRDTTKIYEALKSFVDDYNKLIKKLNGNVDEEATYRDYAPLTTAQKKDMSESEIKLWEEKSKTGLLRNDSNITSFLSGMRSALYTKPDGADFALYQIGIETSSEWEDKGKLIIDESKLKTMIETNPQDIAELFTNVTDGLGTKLNSVIKATASTYSSTPGTLVALAGVVGKATEITNTITKQIRSINSKLEDLQDRYDTEKARYWKMFNSMESALSSMNSQSSWLSQQFS